MYAVVTISLKNGVLDPQAKAIHHAISSLGFESVSDVIIKKQMILKLQNITKEQAQKETQNIAQDLLANPIIEDYEIQIKED